jgi:hypothetical protein
MTLLFPLPGPWLPIRVAIPTGFLMGLGGYLVARSSGRRRSLGDRLLLYAAGLWAGAYLGWFSARGPLIGQDFFLKPSLGEKVLSAAVCGALGLAANSGMTWLAKHTIGKPIRLGLYLVALLLTLLLAVGILILITGE